MYLLRRSAGALALTFAVSCGTSGTPIADVANPSASSEPLAPEQIDQPNPAGEQPDVEDEVQEEFRSDLLSTALPSDSVNLGPLRIHLTDTQEYAPFFGTSEPVKISILEGIGHSLGNYPINLNDVGASTSRLYVYGLRDTATGTTVLLDTYAYIYDADGHESPFNNSVSYRPTNPSDPSGAAFTGTAQAASGSQFHSYLFWRVDDENGFPSDGKIILGVSTDPIDMPIVGSATYQGNAVTTAHDGDRLRLFDGTSVIEVNFDDALANVAVTSNFTGIDTIVAENMRIDGNKFTGGRVRAILNNTDITTDVTGGVTGTDAAGIFYGPSRTAPAEVGGVISIGGEDTSYHTLFSAN